MMKAHWPTALMLLLLVTGCRAIAPEHPYYNAHEIELLTPTASERWVYFYGDPMVVELEGETLTLEPAGGSSPWAVPKALWVNGMPLWRELLPPVAPEVKVRASYEGDRFELSTETSLLSSWYYDGRGWYRLSGAVPAGKTKLVGRKPGIPRFSKLTADENRVVLRELEARSGGRELVVVERASPLHPRYRFSPSPWTYSRTSLRVLDRLPRAELQSDKLWWVLKQGTYASVKNREPLAYLACSPEGVAELWGMAFGSVLPTPTPPSLEPGHCLAGFFWGVKPSGGYRVSVAGVLVNGALAEVTLELKKPDPGMVTTAALTNPFVILEISRPVEEVRFYHPDGKLLARAIAR